MTKVDAQCPRDGLWLLQEEGMALSLHNVGTVHNSGSCSVP